MQSASRTAPEDDFLFHLEELIDLQYSFLKRSFHRNGGELPEQALSGSGLEQLLSQVFQRALTADERDAAIFSIEQHFEAIRQLCEENGEFPVEEEAWDLFQQFLGGDEDEEEEDEDFDEEEDEEGDDDIEWDDEDGDDEDEDEEDDWDDGEE